MRMEKEYIVEGETAERLSGFSQGQSWVSVQIKNRGLT